MEKDGFLTELKRENEPFKTPCDEFLRFRELLDAEGIPWHDASEASALHTMHRTHGDGFSVIWGRHSYGGCWGLLEARIDGMRDVQGWLTADEALALVKGRGK